eukprot:1630293-Pyramimonas_sp.AAC.1
MCTAEKFGSLPCESTRPCLALLRDIGFVVGRRRKGPPAVAGEQALDLGSDSVSELDFEDEKTWWHQSWHGGTSLRGGVVAGSTSGELSLVAPFPDRWARPA